MLDIVLIPELMFYLPLGAVAGLLAGLFGVGGGTILVPGLLVVFALQGVAPEQQMVAAIATSLGCICLTSISAIAAHHRRGGVRWPVLLGLMPGLIVGAAAGAYTAKFIPADTLRLIFAAFTLIVAYRMLFVTSAPAAEHRLPGKLGLAASGGVIGSISALLGIGGGTLTVPFLSACRVPMAQAVGTSSACGLPLAMAGAASFMLAGIGVADRPPGSVGYVVMPAVASIVVLGIATAPLGARIAHQMPALVLRRAFGVLLVLVGVKLLIN